MRLKASANSPSSSRRVTGSGGPRRPSPRARIEWANCANGRSTWRCSTTAINRASTTVNAPTRSNTSRMARRSVVAPSGAAKAISSATRMGRRASRSSRAEYWTGRTYTHQASIAPLPLDHLSGPRVDHPRHGVRARTKRHRSRIRGGKHLADPGRRGESDRCPAVRASGRRGARRARRAADRARPGRSQPRSGSCAPCPRHARARPPPARAFPAAHAPHCRHRSRAGAAT